MFKLKKTSTGKVIVKDKKPGSKENPFKKALADRMDKESKKHEKSESKDKEKSEGKNDPEDGEDDEVEEKKD